MNCRIFVALSNATSFQPYFLQEPQTAVLKTIDENLKAQRNLNKKKRIRRKIRKAYTNRFIFT